jgi:alpha-beta hydrolase superfamily lysophospholipase
VQGHAAPTLILHGMRDTAVLWQDSVSFMESTRSPDMELLLIKDGDHRLTDHKAHLFDVIAAWLKRKEAMR